MLAPLAATAHQETVTDSSGVKASFIVLAGLFGLSGSLSHIGIDFGSVVQVIPDYRVNISELEGRILLSDFFRSRPVGKCHDDRIKGNAGFTYAHDAIGVSLQRQDIGRTRRDHMSISTDYMLIHLTAKSKENLLPMRNPANAVGERLANLGHFNSTTSTNDTCALRTNMGD